MKYKSVLITQRGGPEVLKIVEQELREPQPSEVRIKILATAVGRTDITMRYRTYSFAPKIPFVPGYQMIGIVDALGQGVSRFSIGQRVAALTVHGSYAEYIYLGAEHLAPVPENVDLAEAVTLILNYITAYQMLHRVAKVKAGQKILITGASGGVGTALLELGKLAGLKMYGTASPKNHGVLTGFGAIPIDYKTPDLVHSIHEFEPGGLDIVTDGMGSGAIGAGFAILAPGGKFVEYGYNGLGDILSTFIQLWLRGLFSQGKSGAFYGITALYRQNKTPFFEDLAILFKLLAEGKLKPVIAAKMPILEAAKANELLETGGVSGQIVLLSPEQG